MCSGFVVEHSIMEIRGVPTCWGDSRGCVKMVTEKLKLWKRKKKPSSVRNHQPTVGDVLRQTCSKKKPLLFSPSIFPLRQFHYLIQNQIRSGFGQRCTPVPDPSWACYNVGISKSPDQQLSRTTCKSVLVKFPPVPCSQTVKRKQVNSVSNAFILLCLRHGWIRRSFCDPWRPHKASHNDANGRAETSAWD